jgi:hypothetical protein
LIGQGTNTSTDDARSRHLPKPSGFGGFKVWPEQAPLTVFTFKAQIRLQPFRRFEAGCLARCEPDGIVARIECVMLATGQVNRPTFVTGWVKWDVKHEH